MEKDLLILICAAMAAIGGYRLIMWIRETPVRPDPWDESVSAGLEQEDSQALCCRCLEPVEEGRHFCEHCGLPVGECTNLMPYPYLFSLGDRLRTGAFGDFAVRPLTVMGFALLALGGFALLAPAYWVMLFLNVLRQCAAKPAMPPVA